MGQGKGMIQLGNSCCVTSHHCSQTDNGGWSRDRNFWAEFISCYKHIFNEFDTFFPPTLFPSCSFLFPLPALVILYCIIISSSVILVYSYIENSECLQAMLGLQRHKCWKKKVTMLSLLFMVYSTSTPQWHNWTIGTKLTMIQGALHPLSFFCSGLTIL